MVAEGARKGTDATATFDDDNREEKIADLPAAAAASPTTPHCCSARRCPLPPACHESTTAACRSELLHAYRRAPLCARAATAMKERQILPVSKNPQR